MNVSVGEKEQMLMRKQVEEFIQKQELLTKGEHVLTAVSGGADSTCLLYLLIQMREDWDLEVRAVHVNHGLRGKEADRDADFTKAFCKEYEVPCSIRRVPVRETAGAYGLSLEEAARSLRYQVLKEEACSWERESGKTVKIAVAHHGDDNAETILHNLFRGSGLRGLGGIRPVRENIIRPLLTVTRREILTYLKQEGICFCTDSSNQWESCTRNKLRLKVMPLICAQVNERASEHILQASERVHQADEYLEHQAKLWLEQYGVREYDTEGRASGERTGADARQLYREPEIIQTYVIRQLILELAGSRKDITSIHVEALRQLLYKQAGKQVDLPDGLMGRRTYDNLWIERTTHSIDKRTQHGAGDGICREEKAPSVEFEVFSYEKGMEIPQNQYTKWFDYDKIKGALSVRTRQRGDYFLLPGGGHKTIKAYLIDEKVPAEQRDNVFLLAEGSHILWIIGRRISEAYKVTAETKRILQVHISGGKEDGR